MFPGIHASSIHMLRPETYPLDDAIYAAFDASAVAAFELHLDPLEAAAPLMVARGLYQDGRALSDVLPDTLRDELAKRFTEVGIPMAATDRVPADHPRRPRRCRRHDR